MEIKKNNPVDISITYVIFTYNQEQYIEDAVLSALNQTYSPMDIIISDDCSSDKTFKIIIDLCKQYTGPNKLHLRSNKKNLGLVRHFNKVMSLVSSDLVIVASGDDVARSDKVEEVIRCKMSTDALVIGCNPEIINESGIKQGRFYSSSIPYDFSWRSIVKRRNAGVFISAFDRRIFDKWGSLDEFLPIEDQSIPFRASLMKENAIYVIDEPLVQYRSHNASIVSSLNFSESNEGSLKTFLRKFDSHVNVHKSWYKDLEYSNVTMEHKPVFLKLIRKRITEYSYLIDVISNNVLKERLEIWRNYSSFSMPEIIKELIFILPALSPTLFISLLSSFVKIKWWLKRQPLGY